MKHAPNIPNLEAYEAIVQLITQHCGPACILGKSLTSAPPTIRVPVQDIANICQLLHTHPNTYFDYLTCITALDNGPELGLLEVLYKLYSIPYNISLMLQVSVHRTPTHDELPKVPSVSHIWRGANWYEREAYDLVGLHFTQHPDLRRILLPADWQGHPLRKDYTPPLEYQGIKTTD